MSVVFEPRHTLSILPSRIEPLPATQASVAPEMESRHLLQGRSEVLIRHGQEVYRLRHTRNDKLILTK